MGRQKTLEVAKKILAGDSLHRQRVETRETVYLKPLSQTATGPLDKQLLSPTQLFSPVVVAEPDNHPYQICFYKALEKQGVRLVDGLFSLRWLLKNLNAGEYVHLHWPSFHYAGATTRFGLLILFIRFITVLLLVRMRRAKLLWTAHNLMPHVPTPIPGMDWLGRRIVIGLSHRVFVHGASAGAVLYKRFPSARAKIALIHHGHWVDYFPRTQTKRQARDKLRLHPDAFVFLFIGQCKEYKNIHGLIKAYRDLPLNSILLIAGEFQRYDYQQKILAMVEGDERIKLFSRYIPDDELQDFLSACDCVVLPYLEILTSGAAMLAFSFGRPVVSVRMGCLKDIVTDEVGLLYEPNNPDGLHEALIEAETRSFDEEEILAHARRFSWTTTARSFIDALNP